MTERRDLHTLCSLCGIQTSYVDVLGRRRRAATETLLAMLEALSVPIRDPGDAPRAIRALRRQRWRRPIEPVTAVWGGNNAAVTLRLPASHDGRVSCRLELEDGDVREWKVDADALAITAREEVDGETFAERRLDLGAALPDGYHTLHVHAGRGLRASATVVASPVRALAPPRARRRTWGVFAPCYALHSRESMGVGDLRDLGDLLAWIRDQGGSTVGTLPLLASYLDTPFDPSPYAPVSRRYWNELYLDLDAIPEIQTTPSVAQLRQSRHFQSEQRRLQSRPLVDYQRSMDLKRQVLERLSRRFFSAREPSRFRAFRDFVRRHRDVERYARFRAVAERRRATWQEWPGRLQEGAFRAGDFSVEAERYHQYVQFIAHEQIGGLAGGHDGQGLYLDLPLGVHGGGYDVWRHRSRFLEGVSVGAPPDAFFTRGQNWGFPPLSPERSRDHGHAYFRAVLEHHMRVAGTLRIDHIMGFHRLYCIPRGHDASNGVYLRYPADEFYAVTTLESHRHGTVVAGEDLGTVPRDVRRAMGRHGIQRTFVVQYEASPEASGVARAPSKSVASLNTHDMPTFNAFWNAFDIRDRVDLGLLDNAAARHEREDRARVRDAIVASLRRDGWLDRDRARAPDVIRALLRALAAGPAWMVLVTIEDLWRESRPQNVPGTSTERPNWRRKMRYQLEEVLRKRVVAETLAAIDQQRRKV